MAEILVLGYHAVSEDWSASLSVTPAALEQQLEILVRRGYVGATFHDAVHARPARRTVAVTFDDAYLSVLELALPIMARLGLPGTMFVPTDYVGARCVWPGIDNWLGGPHHDELQAMSWAQLHTLADAGWEIGSHTCTHPHLTQIPDAALVSELVDSRRICEQHMRRPCPSLAYPYGDHDARVVAATRAAGYTAACTLPKRMNCPGPLQRPRVGIYFGDDEWRFRAKVSPAVQRIRASRAWPSSAPPAPPQDTAATPRHRLHDLF